MLTLQPMHAARFAEFSEASVLGYAEDNVKAGRWAEAGSVERSRADFTALLPQGLDTPNQYFFDAMNAAGEAVGILWMAIQPGPTGRQAWVYDIEVEASQRGKGYGRAIMLAFEAEARRLGASSLGLNVFGYNDVASKLYQSLGFKPVSTQMSKPL